MCNNLVLIPSYTNTTVAPHNAEALAAWPGGAARQDQSTSRLRSDRRPRRRDALHLHARAAVPRPADATGFAPTAYLRTPNGGTGLVYTPRLRRPDPVDHRRRQRRHQRRSPAQLRLRRYLAGHHRGRHHRRRPAHLGRPQLLLPHRPASALARDADGRTGLDVSDADFTLAGTCRADFNNSRTLTVQDIFDFLAAYFAGDARADFNGSGGVTVRTSSTSSPRTSPAARRVTLVADLIIRGPSFSTAFISGSAANAGMDAASIACALTAPSPHPSGPSSPATWP